MENKTVQKGGSEHITALIKSAVECGRNEAHVTGSWEIESAVRIPSDFTIYLDNCYLVMADKVYSNMFVNEHHDTDIGRTTEGTDRNISIIGDGNSILDGGNYNGLSESTTKRPGMPPIWKNNLILFTNVKGFKISGIECHNQRWWALNFIYCSDGYIGNIHFISSNLAVDKDGNMYRGLIRSRAIEVLVFNSDGVDIRQGCHDILIENITGFTEDDTVAITGLNGQMEQHFAVSGLSPDMYNITVRNVKAEAFCSLVRLLNQDGIVLHDVLVDGVYNTWKDATYMDVPGGGVLLGDSRLFGARNSTLDECYNITIRNVYGKIKGLRIAHGAGNLVFENINSENEELRLLDER